MSFGACSIAVVLPCYNEASTIARVIEDFRAALPEAQIYVFDNASTDRTAAAAREAGALVIEEPRRGKGNVVRRIFAEVDADVYVMADGDGTYDAARARHLVSELVARRLDMVVGARKDVTQDAGRRGHAFGNRLFNSLFQRMFGNDFSDIFSGYRVLSRRFVKSFPAISAGFEIETEMAVHASQLRMPVCEIVCDYGRREGDSKSKLRTMSDGLRILRTFFLLTRETRPTLFYGMAALVFAISSIALAVPIFITYLESGLVPRLPTAVLATGLMIIAGLLMTCGMILGSLAFSRIEQKRILYLGIPGPKGP